MSQIKSGSILDCGAPSLHSGRTGGHTKLRMWYYMSSVPGSTATALGYRVLCGATNQMVLEL